MTREFKKIQTRLSRARKELEEAQALLDASPVQWDGDPVECALESVEHAENMVTSEAENN